MEPVSPEDGVALLEEDMCELRGLRARVASLELNILQFHAEVRTDVSAIRQDLHGAVQLLRVEIRAGDTETRRYLRVLHEEVLSRIAGIHRRGG
jgi:hypothetical protein